MGRDARCSVRGYCEVVSMTEPGIWVGDKTDSVFAMSRELFSVLELFVDVFGINDRLVPCRA